MLRSAVAVAAVAGLSLGAAPAPAAAALISQGALRMGADALWSTGQDGAGQTVVVLDLGFGGLDRAIELGELPPRAQLASRSFDATYGLDGRTALGGPTQHGVRIAEIVHDIAPAARLVLVNYHTQEEFAAAVEWIVAQGHPIVAHANSFLTPPFDGTGPSARVVDRAAAAGVLWVNSVGNYGRRHWVGPAPADLPLTPRAGEWLHMSLGWTAPGVVAHAAIERRDGAGAWTEVARTPAGGGLSAPVRVDGGDWRVAVRQEAGPPAELELFSRTVGFAANAVVDSSVPTPGDAAGALAVGAVRWTGTTLAPYSSRGPTNSGRAKPDVVAPTYVNSNPEWPGTAGTSAATAHVAGAAALVRARRAAAGLAVDPATLRAALALGALDLGAPGPDLLYGRGQVRLDRSAPRVTLRIGRGTRRALRVSASDRGTLVRLEVRLDGRLLARARRPWLRLRLPRLRPGRHRIVARAEDLAGNVGHRRRALRVR